MNTIDVIIKYFWCAFLHIIFIGYLGIVGGTSTLNQKVEDLGPGPIYFSVKNVRGYFVF